MLPTTLSALIQPETTAQLVTPASEVVIHVEDVHKYYELGETRVHALRGVSVDIKRGEFCAIMGASITTARACELSSSLRTLIRPFPD